MRHYCFLSFLLSVTMVSVTAQTATTATRMSKGMFSAIPKEITSDDNEYLILLENDVNDPTINIYSDPDENGLVKTISLPLQDSGNDYYEVADGIIENIIIEGKFCDRFTDFGIMGSVAQMDSVIKAVWGYWDFHLIPFTDADSMPAYYGSHLSSNKFYKFQKYGTKYPYEYFALDSLGYLCLYHYFEYAIQTDTSNISWTKDLEYSQKQGYQEKDNYLASFMYQDIGKSLFPTNQVIVSQTLFDDDTDWEYMVFDMGFHKNTSDQIQKYSDEKYRRRIEVIPYFKGMKILDDKGNEEVYISFPDKDDEHTVYVKIRFISLIKGTLYIQTDEDVLKGSLENDDYKWTMYNGLYALNPVTSKVETIRRAQTRMDISPTVIQQGDRLDIHVTEPGQNENITISSMSGQTLKTTNIASGQTSFETGSIDKGIYNVTLYGKDSPTENQRIIVK